MRAALLISLLTAGCATAFDLSYVPEVPSVTRAVPTISGIEVIDARQAQFPAVVGTISDHYGNPHRSLVTTAPLERAVGAVVRQALDTRNMVSPTGPDTLQIQVVRLEGDARPGGAQAVAALTYRLRDADGTQRFAGVSDKLVSAPPRDDAKPLLAYLGRYVYPGILGYPGPFGSAAELQAVIAQALTQAVDAALDNPDFTAALRQLPPPHASGLRAD